MAGSDSGEWNSAELFEEWGVRESEIVVILTIRKDKTIKLSNIWMIAAEEVAIDGFI